MHAAFEGKRAVGGAGAFPLELSVPGGTVPCAGVTVVGVYPTHRRRGILTSMMRAQLDDVRARGEPIAALWASDERIYGRYGYGLAGLVGEIELPRQHGEFAAPFEARGTVRYVEPADVPATLGPIWDHVLRNRPGMFRRFERLVGGAGRLRLAGVARECGAEALRRRRARRRGGGLRHVPPCAELGGGNRLGQDRRDRGVRALAPGRARALALPPRHGVDEQGLGAAPPARPSALPRSWPRRGGCACASATASGYASSTRRRTRGCARTRRPGRSCSRSRTTSARWNAGRWKLENGEAKKTRAEADLACDVTALGSVYLGGFTFAQLVRGDAWRS